MRSAKHSKLATPTEQKRRPGIKRKTSHRVLTGMMSGTRYKTAGRKSKRLPKNKEIGMEIRIIMLLLLLHLVKPSAVFSRERNWECTGETRERLGSRNCGVVGSARERSFFLLFSLGGVFPWRRRTRHRSHCHPSTGYLRCQESVLWRGTQVSPQKT